MRKIEDKLIDYLEEHKKAVTVKQMAKYFIASETAVQRALNDLVTKSVAEIVPKSRPFLYRSKR